MATKEEILINILTQTVEAQKMVIERLQQSNAEYEEDLSQYDEDMTRVNGLLADAHLTIAENEIVLGDSFKLRELADKLDKEFVDKSVETL